MIAYFDTSALMRLVLDEPHGEQTFAIWEQARTLLTASIATVEARSSLARARKGNRLSTARFREACAHIARWLDETTRIGIDALAEPAATLTELHGLRTLDALHLAAAISAEADLFVSWDLELVRAAAASGMAVPMQVR